MRSDILSGLAGQYAVDPAYDAFAEDWCGGKDPVDADVWVVHIWKLARGEESELW